MRAATTIAVCALVALLFVSVGLNGWLAYERETARELVDEARQFGFVPRTEQPACGWVKVPRCAKCYRFHAPPAYVLPGPGFEPAPIEVFPTPAPPRDAIPDDDPARFLPDADAAIGRGRIFDGALSDQGKTLIAYR